MTNEQDLLAREIARQTAPSGNPRQAASGGVAASPSSVSQSRIVDGRVKRLWLTGDAWDSSFFFGAYN